MSTLSTDPSLLPLPPFQLFVGIDIAAKSFTTSILKNEVNAQPQRSQTFQQSPQDFASFEKSLRATGFLPAQILVVMEATSTYWLNLAVFLHEAGFALRVVNPAQPYHFAKIQLRKVKTDALDAVNLALFARAKKDELKAWNPPPQIYYELHQRLAHRDQLLNMRQQLKNQLHALQANAVIIPSVQQSMEQLIVNFTLQLKQLEKDIEKIASDTQQEWAKTIQLLQTIPGIGLITAALMVAIYFNFTNCHSAQAATQYAGLAPNVGFSGTSVRNTGHIGGGGNAPLRRMLYMATLSAARYNPVIKAFYESHSVSKEGKQPMKVARCAAARKLLHLAYGVATKQTAFDVDYYNRQKELRLQPKAATISSTTTKAC